MSDSTLEALQYPIGRFSHPEHTTPAQHREWMRVVENTPAELRAAVAGLTEEQLSTPYRPGGWTIRQVAHHLPDSHMNTYIRFKMALTEDVPTIKPYDEVAWAKLADSAVTPVEVSVTMLECLHERWSRLMESMSDADFERKFHHPEVGTLTLGRYLAGLAWHGPHHVAHIRNLRVRMGW